MLKLKSHIQEILLTLTTFIGIMYVLVILASNMCPPGAPGNLTAQVIFDPNPQVQLGWQDNSWERSWLQMC